MTTAEGKTYLRTCLQSGQSPGTAPVFIANNNSPRPRQKLFPKYVTVGYSCGFITKRAKLNIFAGGVCKVVVYRHDPPAEGGLVKSVQSWDGAKLDRLRFCQGFEGTSRPFIRFPMQAVSIGGKHLSTYTVQIFDIDGSYVFTPWIYTRAHNAAKEFMKSVRSPYPRDGAQIPTARGAQTSAPLMANPAHAQPQPPPRSQPTCPMPAPMINGSTPNVSSSPSSPSASSASRGPSHSVSSSAQPPPSTRIVGPSPAQYSAKTSGKRKRSGIPGAPHKPIQHQTTPAGKAPKRPSARGPNSATEGVLLVLELPIEVQGPDTDRLTPPFSPVSLADGMPRSYPLGPKDLEKATGRCAPPSSTIRAPSSSATLATKEQSILINPNGAFLEEQVNNGTTIQSRFRGIFPASPPLISETEKIAARSSFIKPGAPSGRADASSKSAPNSSTLAKKSASEDIISYAPQVNGVISASEMSFEEMIGDED